MCAPFNLKLATAEAPLQDTSITRLLRDVSCLHMGVVMVMETDLKISKIVKKLVHQVMMWSDNHGYLQ